LKQGLVTEQTIRQIARRGLTLFFRLGLMDPPEMVPYTRIAFNEIDSAAHRKVAQQLARESMTLLKNDGNLLPLNAQKVRSVALIGPYATQVVTGMSTPTSSTISPSIKAVADALGIKTLVHSYGRMEIANFDDSSSPVRRFDDDVTYVGGRVVSRALGGGSAEWLSYKNVDFTGLKKVTLGMQRIGVPFSVELRQDKPDGPLVGSLDISVKQDQGRFFDIDVTNPVEGIHDLYLTFVPKQPGLICQPFVMDLHRESATGPEIYSVSEPGQKPKLAYASGVVVPWTPGYGMINGAKPRSIWGLQPGQMDENRMMLLQESANPDKQFAEAVALAKSSEVAIVFAGFDERHSYEYQDRTDLNLPGQQAELIKAVAKVNPNTIVVLKVGGPVAGDWVKDVKAILCAWHVGQDEGQSIAATLFGDNNPAGRSPVTWYNDISEVPDFLDYNIRAGRTYQYFKGKPLFPFGHGLSYTRFDYGEMKLSKSKLSPGQKVGVEVKVKNVGDRAGDEVVQLYVKEEHPAVDRPLKQLAGFKRITLKPGEEKLVQLELPYDFLAFYDEASKTMKVNPGSFRVMVGASSEDIRQQASIEVPAKK
jgi:beta-glucosidase